MAAEGRRRFSDIHHHVENLANHSADQLALWLVDLVMETSQHPPGRPRMAVLNEACIDARRGKVTRIPTLVEESAIIAEYPGLDQKHVRNGGRQELHGAFAANLRNPALVSSRKS